MIKLFNEKRVEIEAGYKRLMDAHSSQNSQILALQERLRQTNGLEETCKRQEIVIEKMEGLIKKIVDQGDFTA